MNYPLPTSETPWELFTLALFLIVALVYILWLERELCRTRDLTLTSIENTSRSLQRLAAASKKTGHEHEK